MNIGMLVAIALLVIWAIGALVLQGPGWIHLLLTLGVSLLIYSVVARSGENGTGKRNGAAPRR